MKLKNNAIVRHVSSVGPGDYVKIRGSWRQIISNDAHGSGSLPKSWTVITEDGHRAGMFDIQRYAKAEDLE